MVGPIFQDLQQNPEVHFAIGPLYVKFVFLRSRSQTVI